MTKNGNYADLMPGLFEEFEKASKISVVLREGSELNLFTRVAEPALVSVNGYETPQALGASLKRLGDRLITRAMGLQADFVPGERNEFLGQVIQHFHPVATAVKPVPATQLQEWMPGTNLGGLWIFREIRVGAEGEVLLNGSFPVSLHVAARKFAAAWRNSTNETLEQLKILSLMVSFFPGRKDLGLKTEPEPKIIVTDTVEVMAVMTKVMSECNVFNISNKAELCRLMCRSFGTRHTSNMSFNNFKNCFDLPGRNPLIFVIDGLTMMTAVAKRMLEGVSRSEE